MISGTNRFPSFSGHFIDCEVRRTDGIPMLENSIEFASNIRFLQTAEYPEHLCHSIVDLFGSFDDVAIILEYTFNFPSQCVTSLSGY